MKIVTRKSPRTAFVVQDQVAEEVCRQRGRRASAMRRYFPAAAHPAGIAAPCLPPACPGPPPCRCVPLRWSDRSARKGWCVKVGLQGVGRTCTLDRLHLLVGRQQLRVVLMDQPVDVCIVVHLVNKMRVDAPPTRARARHPVINGPGSFSDPAGRRESLPTAGGKAKRGA